MSDFEMPKDLGDYAPKRGLAAVAAAVADYKPPQVVNEFKPPNSSDAIKERLKQLTHRQMRQLCAEIFKASEADSITLASLPDVLDKFAYGD